MLDIKFIRENKDLIAMAAKKKHLEFNVEELLKLDDKRREALAVVEKKRAEQNRKSEDVGRAHDDARRRLLVEELRALKAGLADEEERLKAVLPKWQALMLQVPNIPDMSVPDGTDERENKEVKIWGAAPQFLFQPKSHIELLERLDALDLIRGGEVSGFRGYFLKNDAALLSFALWQFALEHFLKKGGFTPMLVPSLMRRQALLGTSYLPQGEADLYKTQDGEYLAGTAEVGTMAYFADAILKVSELPKRLLSFSPCFRREAGSYGKDEKGIFRVHEFFKLEQVALCEANHETSVSLHEELERNIEELIEALGIPYRVVINCGGDLGLGQVKKYDLELWHPSEGRYREISSASYFHDFQTRRLNIRYKDPDGKTRFAHSLNCTALPTPRILIALVENNQREDGSVVVPEALRKYMGKEVMMPLRAYPLSNRKIGL